MFAEIYGNNYPFSKTVEQGLKRVLGERYNGSPHEFMNNFILPTATLLKKAEAKVSTAVVFVDGTQWFPRSLLLIFPSCLFLPHKQQVAD